MGACALHCSSSQRLSHGVGAVGESADCQCRHATANCAGTPPHLQAAGQARGPDQTIPSRRLEIYGFAMLDDGYDFERNDPLLVRRDPADQAACRSRASSEGTATGSRSVAAEPLRREGTLRRRTSGELRTIFEFDMFGVGVDAGQTTFRLRHAWGELEQIGAGQT